MTTESITFPDIIRFIQGNEGYLYLTAIPFIVYLIYIISMTKYVTDLQARFDDSQKNFTDLEDRLDSIWRLENEVAALHAQLNAIRFETDTRLIQHSADIEKIVFDYKSNVLAVCENLKMKCQYDVMDMRFKAQTELSEIQVAHATEKEKMKLVMDALYFVSGVKWGDNKWLSKRLYKNFPVLPDYLAKYTPDVDRTLIA